MATRGTDPEDVLGHRIDHINDLANRPSRIIFREITMVATGSAGNRDLDVVYVNHDKIFDGDIDDFIDTIKDYPLTLAPPESLVPVESPLDLNCKEDCFIVFYLSSHWNWQLQSSGGCFTTKKDRGNKYGNLTHVKRGGDRVTGSNPIGENCRLLYFRAKCTPHYPNGFDGFNLHVELRLPLGRRTRLIIDPDIRNPGGDGEP